MLKLADGKLSAYKGDYKPVEIYKNNKILQRLYNGAK